jgi:hypothetical protein
VLSRRTDRRIGEGTADALKAREADLLVDAAGSLPGLVGSGDAGSGGSGSGDAAPVVA